VLVNTLIAVYNKNSLGTVLMQEFFERKVPAHLAIIMDGNGRWAARRGLSRSQGHQAGAAARRTGTGSRPRRRCLSSTRAPRIMIIALLSAASKWPPDISPIWASSCTKRACP